MYMPEMNNTIAQFQTTESNARPNLQILDYKPFP
jgi:hypothetical protein